MKRFEFKVINKSEVDYSKPLNGNNGNYELIEVTFDGKKITEVLSCDYNIVDNDYIKDNLTGGIEFYIDNNKVVKKLTDAFGYERYENFNIETKSWEVDDLKTHKHFQCY